MEQSHFNIDWIGTSPSWKSHNIKISLSILWHGAKNKSESHSLWKEAAL